MSGIDYEGRPGAARRALALLAAALAVVHAMPAFAQETAGFADLDRLPPADGSTPPADADDTAQVPVRAAIFARPRPAPTAPPMQASLLAEPAGTALDCMTMAIAYEAGNQPLAGQQAVGQVILNRTHVARFPRTVCGVVFDGATRLTGCQFTFTCDGSLRRRLRDETLASARYAAEQVLSGSAPDLVGGATHYHADYVNPYWAATGTRVARIGAHLFYRMPGDAHASRVGTVIPAALVEPVPAALAASPIPRFAALARGRRAAPANPVRTLFTPWGLPVSGLAQR